MKKPLFLLMLCVILFFCLASVCYSQHVIKMISRAPYPYWDENAHINNNGYVVWERLDETDYEIFLYDGSTVSQLTDNSYDDTNSQINDNGYLVWEGYDGTDWEIFLYDGTKSIQLTDNSYNDYSPQINNNGHVVWHGYDGTDYEIFLYDGTTTRQLTDNSYHDVVPQINNNGYVAWLTTGGINLYDGMNITQIINDSDCGWVDLRINDKGYVVWSGDLDPCDGIFLYNGIDIKQLRRRPGMENLYPDLNNSGHVVWQVYNGHGQTIMLFDGTKKIELTNHGMHPKINDKDEIVWWNQGYGSIIFYHNSIFTELTNSLHSAWGPQEPQLNDNGFVVFQGVRSNSEIDIYLASRVSVVSPDGGEVVPSGLPSMIRWVGPSVATKYKVKYSTDNGLTWNKAHQEPYVTETTLDWNVRVPLGNRRKSLVEVIGFNASGTAVSRDQSDRPFTIEVLKLTSPNAGEPPITSGGQHTITWKTNTTIAPVDHIVLSYTLNDGLTWKTIDTTADSADDGSFIWNVPDVSKQKNNCKVKIVLKDASGNTVGSDVSDGVFTIQPTPLP